MSFFLEPFRVGLLLGSMLVTVLVELKGQDLKISYFHPTVSSDGIVAFDSNLHGTNGIYILRKNGDYSRVSPEGVSSSHPAWSSDGRFVSYESNRNGNYDVYAYDFERKEEIRITNSDSTDAVSKWAPDFTVLFESNRSGKFKIYRQHYQGKQPAQLLTDRLEVVNYPVWSPDGSMVLFSTVFDGDMELCVADSEFNNIKRLTHSKGYDAWGGWSSDGEKVAFTSGRSGSNEIYMINVDGTGLTQITKNTENSAMPSFLPDGSGIVFMSRQGGKPSRIYSINIDNRQQEVLTKTNR